MNKKNLFLIIFVLLVSFFISIQVTQASQLSKVSMTQNLDYLFLADSDKGYIYVFSNDDQTLVKTIITGNSPSHLLIDSNYLFVALSSSKRIMVIDTQTLLLVGEINTPKMPYWLSKSGNRIFSTVSRSNGSNFEPFVIYLDNNDILNTSSFQPSWPSFNFVGNEHSMIDSMNANIFFGNKGYSPDNIVHYSYNNIEDIKHLRTSPHGSLGSNGKQFVLDWETIYYACGSGGTGGYNLQVISSHDLTKIADLSLGAYPNAVDYYGSYIYAGKSASHDGGDIKVYNKHTYILDKSYDLPSNETLVDKGISAYNNVYAASNKYLYLLNPNSDKMTRIYDFVNDQEIVDLLPDLTVTDIDFSASTMNEEGKLTVTIKNLGGDLNTTSGLLNWYTNFSAQNFIFSSQTPSINGYNINRPLPSNSNPLKQGEVIVFSWYGRFNTQGSLYLHFTVNNNNELEESNTNNNTHTTIINILPETEPPTKKPDLVGDGVSIRDGENSNKLLMRDPIADEKFYVWLSYKNIGQVKTNNTAFHVNVYVNDIFKKQLKATNNDYLVNLGDSMAVDEMLELSLPAGTHAIKFVLDVNNAIDESNVNNNTYTTIINVGAKQALNEIEKINKRSEDLLYGRIDQLLSDINQLRNQVREQETQIKYLQHLTTELSKTSAEMQTAINAFITYGVDDNTRRLGEGERAAVINSFKAAYGKLPNSEQELSDVIKIANGRWPTNTNINAENRAKQEFINIYKRQANMNNPHDNAAVTIMAYGLRQKAENRNLSSESAGLNTFRNIYGRLPQSTEDWNILQAITYSGATR